MLKFVVFAAVVGYAAAGAIGLGVSPVVTGVSPILGYHHAPAPVVVGHPHHVLVRPNNSLASTVGTVTSNNSAAAVSANAATNAANNSGPVAANNAGLAVQGNTSPSVVGNSGPVSITNNVPSVTGNSAPVAVNIGTRGLPGPTVYYPPSVVAAPQIVAPVAPQIVAPVAPQIVAPQAVFAAPQTVFAAPQPVYAAPQPVFAAPVVKHHFGFQY